jgi:hypothetical protein
MKAEQFYLPRIENLGWLFRGIRFGSRHGSRNQLSVTGKGLGRYQGQRLRNTHWLPERFAPLNFIQSESLYTCVVYDDRDAHRHSQGSSRRIVHSKLASHRTHAKRSEWLRLPKRNEILKCHGKREMSRRVTLTEFSVFRGPGFSDPS